MKNTLIEIAQVCHEVNRAFCTSIGDNSQKSWEDCDDWQQQSAIHGVKFKLENPESTPENLHKNWSNDKFEAGWSFGTVKDPVAKTHPCLVPYDQLPVEQRSKDYIFASVVDTLSKF